MFARVQRGDLALTVVALTGLASGVALTVVKTLGVTGPVLIGVGIAAAVATAVPGARNQVSQVLARQHQQSESLLAILAAPVKPVGEVDPFTIGVFPSTLAETACQDSAQPGEKGNAPPYVPRGVDVALHRALEESSLSATGRLVVLRGDPKSGKSRSLWEAVRTLPGRNLLAVAYPDTVAATADPAFEPLTALAGLDRPVSRSQGRDLVIWVDDAHRHLQRGLTRNTLRRLAALYPKAVIAMTIHSHELDGLRNIDPDLHARLRRHFDVLLLSPRLSPHELASARSAYPSLADDPDLKRLPELFAAVNLLIDRYQHHRADEPAGVAVAKAAIDWQRAGMPPGSIDEPTLRALAGLVLADIAPNQDLDDWAFKHGLTWAREESAVFAALVRRDPASSSQVQRFRAFDAVVSWAHHHDAPIDHKTWSFVLANARNRDLLSVGISAYMTGEWDLAIDAFQQAARSTNPSVAAGALIGKAVALEQVGRYEDELAAYDEIVERFDDAEDPALSQHVATALSRKGSRRRQLDHLGAQAADEQVSQQAETTVAPNDAIRIIHLLTEDFMLLHLRSQVEAFRARWPALSDHSPDELALLRPTAPEVPGLGYARTHEIDGIVGVIAWSVTARAALHSRDSRAGRVGRERNRIRRVADKRHLRPEVSDALARFLTDRLDDEIPQCGPDEDIRGRSGSRGRGRPWGRT